FLPEPMLSPPQLGNDAPGWWSTEAKAATLSAFNHETDPTKRGTLWADVQQVVYDEVPYIRAGNFAALAAASEKMEGFTPMPWPCFCTVSHNDFIRITHGGEYLRIIALKGVSMCSQILRRFAGLLIVMFLVTTLLCFITRLAPGDPAALMLGDLASPED